MAKTMKKGKCIHRFSNATKVINKGHLEFFQPTKCPLRLKELPDCKKAPDTSVSGAIIGY